MSMDPNLDPGLEPLPDMMDHSTESRATTTHYEGEDSSASPSGTHPSGVNVAAHLMSAELLVDLATSTLAAATRLKELYIAQQMQRPARGSPSTLPPTDGDVANAKLKVREAAGVMFDLAA